jgi:hypothetical protein
MAKGMPAEASLDACSDAALVCFLHSNLRFARFGVLNNIVHRFLDDAVEVNTPLRMPASESRDVRLNLVRKDYRCCGIVGTSSLLSLTSRRRCRARLPVSARSSASPTHRTDGALQGTEVSTSNLGGASLGSLTKYHVSVFMKPSLRF